MINENSKVFNPSIKYYKSCKQVDNQNFNYFIVNKLRTMIRFKIIVDLMRQIKHIYLNI